MLQIFGNISAPPGVANYGIGGDVFTGLLPFLNNIIRLIFVIAGLFAFFNLILGGLGFISAGGDPKAIEKAWSKIYQSLIGLIIIVSSFVLSAIFGYILFGNAGAILNPKIYGPLTTNRQTSVTGCLTCLKSNLNNMSICQGAGGACNIPTLTVSTACTSCLINETVTNCLATGKCSY